jgi:saccharopine dehydrogenase (NADP+, L-glutamate forming)
VRIAELCLEKGCHFVSSSYVSPAMQALDAQARDKGLCLVNEVGLDPGIDHLMAHALMDDYQKSGAADASHAHTFNSYCGGFPAVPNDFRYKFSWSPLGVLRALKTPARWIDDGEEVTTGKPWTSLSRYAVQLPDGEETFQAYPNRDSIPFAGEYGFGTEFNVQHFVRGTLRLDGWAEAWGEIFDAVESGEGLETLSDKLWEKFAYAPDEPDRVVLHVELQVDANGERVWKGTYALDERGNASGSAMARLVSKTVAIAVEAVLAGELEPGVSAAPSDPATARIWLDRLSESGEVIVRS